MPAMPIGSVVALTFRGEIFDQQWISTFHYRVSQVSTNPTVLTDLSDILDDQNTRAGSLYNRFRLALPVSTAVQDIGAQQIKIARSIRRSIVPTATGGSRGAATTPNLAAVITKGTDSGDRGEVGSVHLPGVATDDMVDGEIIAALVALMEAIGESMRSKVFIAASGLEITPVLYHPDKKDAEGHITRAWFTTDIIRYIVQPQIRVMRRRTIGIGK